MKISSQSLLVLCLTVLFAGSLNIADAQTTAARPDRGLTPGASYAVSDIESMNLQNGNVNLSIPLASLPAMAGGKLSWTISASYNSKLWNMLRQEHAGSGSPYRTFVVDTPSLSDAGGWQIGGGYALVIRNAREDFDYDIPPFPGASDPEWQRLQVGWYKVVLRTPDGAEHELRPTGNHQIYGGVDYPRPYLWGYFKDTPDTTGAPMQYYSTDGTYLSAIVNPPGHPSGIKWALFLPDGTQVIHYANDVQRVRDTNGNTVKIFSDINGAHYQDEHTGREIRVSEAVQANGNRQQQVWYQTVGGVWQHIEVNYGATVVRGKIYKVNDWNPNVVTETGEQGAQCAHHVALPDVTVPVVREIVLPLTEPNQPQRRFSFEYTSDQTESASTPDVFFSCGEPLQTYVRTASKGMGALSRMTTPAGAVVDYGYTLTSTHAFIDIDGADKLTKETVTTKHLTHDSVTDTWTYDIPNNGLSNHSSTLNPDGSTHSQNFFPINPGFALTIGYDEPRAGLVYHTSDGVIETFRHWTMRGVQLASGSQHSSAVNTFVDAEYTSYVGTNIMSAKTFGYDYNGNLIQLKEYDWFDASSVTRDANGVPTAVPTTATLLRTTNTSHYNSAADATSSNYYQTRALLTGVPSILNAVKEVTIGPSITRFSYDGQSYGSAPLAGNLTSQSSWANVDNKWITSSQSYGAYGNLATKTDALGRVTHFFYEDGTHAVPTRVVVDPENGTGPQTSTTTFDFSTGLITSQTDANGKTSEVSYLNHLLGASDPFGRPGVMLGPSVTLGGVNQRHRVTTTYLDQASQSIVASDLHTENDQALKTRTSADMLGRPLLTERTEDGVTYTIYARTAYDQMGKITYASSPMRSNTGATDSWGRTTRDLVGRVTEMSIFGSTSKPPAAGTNASWKGDVTTNYQGNVTVITDQAGKLRRSVTDALGRLVRVDEPDGNGSLGPVNAPSQPTIYEYDMLGNLTKVIQGNQPPREFTYDSLSRLRTAKNPESGTITYTYDDNGNLFTRSDARGVITTYTYDALNRNISVVYSNDPANTPAVTRTYDGATNGKGRLWKTETAGSNGARTVINSYDALGRPTGQSQQFKVAGSWSTEYTVVLSYDLAGNLINQTYPSGHMVNFAYDTAGRLGSFSGNLGDGSLRDYASQFQYTAAGEIQQEKFGTVTPLYHKQRFNQRGQLWDVRLSTKSFTEDAADGDRGAIVNYYSNNFAPGETGSDNNGNLLRQEIYLPGNGFFQQNFAYDSLNRLKSVSETLNGTGNDSFKQSYTYDRWGNRTFDQTNTFGTAVNNKQFLVNVANNRLTAPTGETGQMVYDDAGNLTKDTYSAAAADRVYDAENRMLSETQAGGNVVGNYTYNGDGQRVRRKLVNSEIWQVYGFEGELLAEYEVSQSCRRGLCTVRTTLSTEYGYRSGQLLVVHSADNFYEPRWLVTDHLGTPRIIADHTGTLSNVKRHDYLPFGEELTTQSGRSSASGYEDDALRQKFTSYERDNETGLDYGQARYYANIQGRFTSPDPMLSSGRQAEPQSWNRYAYVVNNPLMFTDPSGLIWGYRDYEQDGKKMREFQWFDGDQAGEGFTNYNHSYFVSQNEVIWLDSGSSAFLQVSKERFSDAEFASLASTDPANIGQEQRATLNRAVADTIWASEGPRIKAVSSLVGGLFGGLGSSLNFTFGAASRQASRLPPVLFHYTDEASAGLIQGSQRLGRPGGELFLTNSGGLTPLQAQLELSLPAQNSARALFAVDSQALNTSNLLRSGRVAGNVFGRPGGGFEFQFRSGTTVPKGSFTPFTFKP